MNPELNWLCPSHGRPMERGEGTDWHGECGCEFPLREGVGVFEDDSRYSTAFGLQWTEWSQTALDSASALGITRARLLATLGQEIARNLPEMRVLEIGCGSGRFTEVLLDVGAVVVAVDLSDAVYVAARNNAPSDNLLILKADVLSLPLDAEQFDLVLALGVVQHTPDSAQTIGVLWRHVKPGGYLVLDHYRSGWVHKIRANQLYRRWLKQLPPDESLRRVKTLYRRWFKIHERVPYRWGRKLLLLVSPIVYFTDEFPGMTTEQRYAWGLLDTYDSLTDVYKHRMSVKEMQEILSRLGPASLQVWEGGNGIAARAKKSQ